MLVQHVEFSDQSAFPVVADPSVKWKWGFPVGLHFNAGHAISRAENNA